MHRGKLDAPERLADCKNFQQLLDLIFRDDRARVHAGVKSKCAHQVRPPRNYLKSGAERQTDGRWATSQDLSGGRVVARIEHTSAMN
jgi:hypothetical protein